MTVIVLGWFLALVAVGESTPEVVDGGTSAIYATE